MKNTAHCYCDLNWDNFFIVALESVASVVYTHTMVPVFPHVGSVDQTKVGTSEPSCWP